MGKTLNDLGLKRCNVRLIPHNPNWKRYFEEESKFLHNILVDYNPQIEHIGSTAVPGIMAKPIIDIAVAIKNLTQINHIIHIMESHQYIYRGEMGIPDRHLFVKGSKNFRTHHIHIMTEHHEQWNSHLLFRDYLKSHIEIAQDYERIKINLKNQFEQDREKYTEGKSGFISEIIKKAKEQIN